MSISTIEYRNPTTPDLRKLNIGLAVRARERTYQAGAWTMYAVATPAVFVGPALISSLVTRLEGAFRAPHYVSWWTCFALASASLIPWLFWMERRNKGRWFEDEMRGQGSTVADAGGASSYGEWRVRTSAATSAMWVEIMLWGPRMFMEAWQRSRTFVPRAVITEATAIINYLRHFDGGVKVKDLPSQRAGPALRYLVERNWVGVSKNSDRVWLLTDARRALQ